MDQTLLRLMCIIEAHVYYYTSPSRTGSLLCTSRSNSAHHSCINCAKGTISHITTCQPHLTYGQPAVHQPQQQRPSDVTFALSVHKALSHT
jgi:hypothetical protein